jgi:uncharacterized protein (DUF488 family)
MMSNRIFTFGYEGLSLQEFVARLHVAGVHTVIDVRANPLSRKRGFSKNAFSDALRKEGVSYIHGLDFGCPKPVRDLYKSNGDWAAYTQSFLAYLQDQTEALTELARYVRGARSCLVCFEADFNRCHRTYVARAAAAISGLKVVHLTNQTEIPDVLRAAA